MQSLVILPLLRVGLQFISYQRLIKFLKRSSASGKLSGDKKQVTAEIEHMVRIAGHVRLTIATCLTRSMTLWWFLRRQGIESDIRFGVRRDGEEIQAHAWVEREGRVINDRSDIHQLYAAFGPASPIKGFDWQ